VNKTEQIRLVNWRLKVLRHASEVTKNVALTCRHFGISRKSFCKWQARYAADGEAGLSDRTRAPRRSPLATSKDVVRKVLVPSSPSASWRTPPPLRKARGMSGSFSHHDNLMASIMGTS
jgi:hypothetical protein